MTSEERVMKAVKFEKTDKIPLWSVYHYGSFISNWRKFLNLDESVEPRQYYGYDTSSFVCNESFFPSEKRIISEDAVHIVENDGYGRVTKRIKNGYFPEVLEYKLKKRIDIDTLKFESVAPEIRYSGLEEYFNNNLNTCMFAKTGGIYIRSHNLWPEEKLLADMLLEQQFCHSLFDIVTEHLLKMSLETLKRTNTWENGLWVYDDMAATYSPMFSPNLFEKYLLPRYKRIIVKCREAGCKHFFFHSDGNILPFMDMLIEAGFEGFNPLEPRSGLDLIKLRERYEKIVLFGGICNTEILPRGSEKEIKKHVMPLIELAKNGGVVLGTASIAGDVSSQAFDYCMSLITDNDIKIGGENDD